MKLNYKTCAYIQSITEHCEIFENRGKMISPVGKVANESSYSHHHSKVTKSLQASEWSSRSGPRVQQIDLTSKRKKNKRTKRERCSKRKTNRQKAAQENNRRRNKRAPPPHISHHSPISHIITHSNAYHKKKKQTEEASHCIHPTQILKPCIACTIQSLSKKKLFWAPSPEFQKKKICCESYHQHRVGKPHQPQGK